MHRMHLNILQCNGPKEECKTLFHNLRNAYSKDNNIISLFIYVGTGREAPGARPPTFYIRSGKVPF